MSTKQPLEPWVVECIEIMLSERVSLLTAASRLGRDTSPQEADDIQRRKAFQSQYQVMARAYYVSRGGPADTDKTLLVGAMLDDARRLRDMGKPKEAAEVTAQAAKILGYAGADTNLNLFADLTGTELQRALETVRSRRAATPKPN